MVRTQIQIPNGLYEAVRRMATSTETSMTQLVREALTQWVATHADPETAESGWRLPPPANLGIRREVPTTRWRVLAHESPAKTRTGAREKQ
jgi:hypothetical protein